MFGRGSGRAARIGSAKVFGRVMLYSHLHKLQLLVHNRTLRYVGPGFYSNAEAVQTMTSRAQCSEVLIADDVCKKFSSLQ